MNFLESIIRWLCYIVVIFIILEAVFFWATVMASTYRQPGQPVAILGNETILVDGLPCQTNTPGFISPTGPNGERYWSKLNRWILPTEYYYSIITDSGNTWVSEYDLVSLPADPDRLLCPSE